MKRFAEYIRVSTGPQAARFGPDVQHQANRLYVGGQGGQISQTYQDVDSGAKLTRTAFNQLLRDAKAGLFDAVVAYKVGRVGRLAFISMQFAEELRKAGLEVHGAIGGVYNLRSSTGRFRYQIDSVFAEYEYESLISNLYAAKMQKAVGGGLPQNWEPYGRKARYLEDGTRLIEIFEPEAMWVRRAFELAPHKGIWAVLDCLQAAPPPRRSPHWSYAGARYLLRNRSYCGDLEFRFKRDGEPVAVRLDVEPIVSRQLFEQVQVALASRRLARRGHDRSDFPLVGLVRCGGCGWRCQLGKYERSRAYFRCCNPRCPETGYHIGYTKAERLALELLAQVIAQPALLLPPVAQRPNREALERQLEALGKRKAKVLEMAELGLYSLAQAQQRLAGLEEARLALESEMAEAIVTPMVDPAALQVRFAALAKEPSFTVFREAGLELVTWRRDKRVLLRATTLEV